MSATEAVPLICDPVPGPPPVIVIPHQLSKADLERLRKRWSEAFVGMPGKVKILDAGCRFEPLAAQRTEWPDAEFCAA
jgi:hypothetical protein